MNYHVDADGIEHFGDDDAAAEVVQMSSWRAHVGMAEDSGQGTADASSEFIDGAVFILDRPDTPRAIWGRGREVLWPEGEALVLVAIAGLGKTSVGGQIVGASAGIGDGKVLGYPVRPCDRTLVLAMDRPTQISGNFARFFTEQDRDTLAERVIVRKGPPLTDFAEDDYAFLELCQRAGLKAGDRVILDSLKDAAVGLSEDRVGASYNRARQRVLAAGIDVLEMHHNVKRGADGGAPTDLADVFGSAWITNGAGSVILLHGKSGDPVVELRHLKKPDYDVGPLLLVHNDDGTTTVDATATDVVEIVRRGGSKGASAEDAAVLLYSKARPSRADVEKARRRLDRKVADGLLVKQDGTRGGGADRVTARWFLAARTAEEP